MAGKDRRKQDLVIERIEAEAMCSTRNIAQHCLPRIAVHRSSSLCIRITAYTRLSKNCEQVASCVISHIWVVPEHLRFGLQHRTCATAEILSESQYAERHTDGGVPNQLREAALAAETLTVGHFCPCGGVSPAASWIGSQSPILTTHRATSVNRDLHHCQMFSHHS